MAPALARRTPKKAINEGRPKRQVVLDRENTADTGKKKTESPAEKGTTKKDSLAEKSNAKGESSASKSKVASKLPVKKKGNEKNQANKKAEQKKTKAGTGKSDTKNDSDSDHAAGSKRRSARTAKKKAEEEEEEQVEEENPNEVKLGDDEKKNDTEDSQTEETEEEEGDSEPDDGELDDDDTDFDPDDDPDKLWCFCKKPHGNRFMICCDTCEEWFHGDCVGISMAKGREMEKTGEEWCCHICSAKASKKDDDESKQSDIKSPLNSPLKKTFQKPLDPATLKKARTLSLDSMKSNLAKLKGRNLSLSETSKKDTVASKSEEEIDENETSLNKKEAAQKDEKESSAKKESDEKETAVLEEVKIDFKREELSKSDQSKTDTSVLEKSTPTKNRSASENSKTKRRESAEKNKPDIADFITFEHVPSAKKDDKNSLLRKRSSDRRDPVIVETGDDAKRRKREEIKGEKPKVRITPTPKVIEPPKICIRDDCNKPVMKGAIYCSRECIYKYANECVKYIEEEKKKNLATLKSPDPKQESSKGTTIISPATSSTDRVMETSQERIAVFERCTGKVVAGVMAPTKKYLFAWLEEHPTYEILKPGKQPSEFKNPKKDHDEVVRSNVRKSLREILITRCKETETAINIEAVGKLCRRIEGELLKLFGETGQKYKTKYRSLIFNLKDSQNKILYKRVVSGEITPHKLVHMTPEQLATPELAQWRQQESKHNIEMIKKREEEEAEIGKQRVLKKTHKGEVEIDDGNEHLETLEIKADTVHDRRPSSASSEVMNLLKDTTEEHVHHLFDSNCKICTGKMVPPGESQVTGVSTAVIQATQEASVPSPSEDEVIVSSPASPDTTEITPSSPVSPTPQAPPSVRKQASVWRGFIMMQKVSKFVCTAYAVSGTCESLMEILPDTIHICGRIPPSQVWDYISQLKEGRKNHHKYIDVIRFEMSSDEEKAGYIKLYTYFYTRQRIGVVGNCYSGVKDMYILPLASHDPIPPELKPLPGLPKPRPHMLLGIIVRLKSKKTQVSDLITIDSSPEIVPKKKKRRKEKRKDKDLEKERVELEAQKKLIDIIFKNRATDPSSSSAPSSSKDVDASALLKTIADGVTKDKIIADDATKEYMEEDKSLEKLTEEHKKIETEQLKKLKEQQEEIFRLQQEVGPPNATESEIVIIPDPESIVKDIQENVLNAHGNKSNTIEINDSESDASHVEIISDTEKPSDDVSPLKVKENDNPMEGSEIKGKNSNEIPLLGLSTSVDSQSVDFSLSNDMGPLPVHTSAANPSLTQSFPILNSNVPDTQQVLNTAEEKANHSQEDTKSQPEDDDYVLNLIEDIKIPNQFPKFPLDIMKNRVNSKMPQLPTLPLPSSTRLEQFIPPPLPGTIPKVPIPPNIKLPPGVPFPPLPPQIPSSTAPVTRTVSGNTSSPPVGNIRGSWDNPRPMSMHGHTPFDNERSDHGSRPPSSHSHFPDRIPVNDPRKQSLPDRPERPPIKQDMPDTRLFPNNEPNQHRSPYMPDRHIVSEGQRMGHQDEYRKEPSFREQPYHRDVPPHPHHSQALSPQAAHPQPSTRYFQRRDSLGHNCDSYTAPHENIHMNKPAMSDMNRDRQPFDRPRNIDFNSPQLQPPVFPGPPPPRPTFQGPLPRPRMQSQFTNVGLLEQFLHNRPPIPPGQQFQRPIISHTLQENRAQNNKVPFQQGPLPQHQVQPQVSGPNCHPAAPPNFQVPPYQPLRPPFQPPPGILPHSQGPALAQRLQEIAAPPQPPSQPRSLLEGMPDFKNYTSEGRLTNKERLQDRMEYEHRDGPRGNRDGRYQDRRNNRERYCDDDASSYDRRRGKRPYSETSRERDSERRPSRHYDDDPGCRDRYKNDRSFSSTAKEKVNDKDMKMESFSTKPPSNTEDLEEGEVVDHDNTVTAKVSKNVSQNQNKVEKPPSGQFIPPAERRPLNVADEQDVWQLKGQYKPWGK